MCWWRVVLDEGEPRCLGGSAPPALPRHRLMHLISAHDQESKDPSGQGCVRARGKAQVVPQRHSHPELARALPFGEGPAGGLAHVVRPLFARSLDDLRSVLCFLRVPCTDRETWKAHFATPLKSKTPGGRSSSDMTSLEAPLLFRSRRSLASASHTQSSTRKVDGDSRCSSRTFCSGGTWCLWAVLLHSHSWLTRGSRAQDQSSALQREAHPPAASQVGGLRAGRLLCP